MSPRVVVVNDTQEILELFREVLESEGYEVVLFSYAPHEVTEIEHARPDLIILDVIFGRDTVGWQLLDKLKLHRPTANIPVVICTVAADAVRQMEGHLKAMGVGVVLKPFDIEVLLSTIRTTIQDAPKTVIAQDQVGNTTDDQHRQVP
jgi:CheY-like chemotaxis protein